MARTQILVLRRRGQNTDFSAASQADVSNQSLVSSVKQAVLGLK